MVNIKNALHTKITIIAVLLILILLVYYNVIGFKINVDLIYQYQTSEEYESLYLCQADIDFYLSEKPEFKSVLEPLLKGIDREKYSLLIIGGGEIESIKMKKNKRNAYPDINFKSNVPKNTISYYIIKNERNIEFHDNYIRE